MKLVNYCNTLVYVSMTNVKESTYEFQNCEATEAFAEGLGRLTRGGEVFELNGDIGAGKTTFIRGFTRGIASNDTVSSPTFTIRNVYQGRLTVYHYDLYRLNDDQLIKNELSEALEDTQGVVILEWAKEVRSVLPENYISIQFLVTSETARTIIIKLPSTHEYLEVTHDSNN